MAKETNILITKASGELVHFAPEKLIRSLTKAGATKAQAEEILASVKPLLHPGISTKTIFKNAFRLLKKVSPPKAGRYKLKNAIMELGPTGFPFEKYFAAILQNLGYKVQTSVILQGVCVKHEVDVIAEKENHHEMVECKFHQQQGTFCNVKIPLYIHARFNDVEAGFTGSSTNKNTLHQGWVVTNTRFTTDAIQYGTCAGLRLIGWNYPKGYSLNSLIDKTGLYPITALTSLTRKEKQTLLRNDIVLCKEIINSSDLLKLAAIVQTKHEAILQEAEELCKNISQVAQHETF
jgi:hypothetical protein